MKAKIPRIIKAIARSCCPEGLLNLKFFLLLGSFGVRGMGAIFGVLGFDTFFVARGMGTCVFVFSSDFPVSMLSTSALSHYRPVG